MCVLARSEAHPFIATVNVCGSGGEHWAPFVLVCYYNRLAITLDPPSLPMPLRVFSCSDWYWEWCGMWRQAPVATATVYYVSSWVVAGRSSLTPPLHFHCPHCLTFSQSPLASCCQSHGFSLLWWLLFHVSCSFLARFFCWLAYFSISSLSVQLTSIILSLSPVYHTRMADNKPGLLY